VPKKKERDYTKKKKPLETKKEKGRKKFMK
jgi:hypothetical protein